MSFFRGTKSRFISIIALLVMLAVLASMVTITVKPETVSAETVDYYKLKLGDETIAVLGKEDDAYQIIKDIQNKFVNEDANVVNVRVSPAMTVEKMTVLKDEPQPKVEAVASRVTEAILDVDDSDSTYTIKDGDTLWDISAELDVTIEELEKCNPDKDLMSIQQGDEIAVKTVEYPVNVTVEYEAEEEVVVPFETVYEEDPEMYVDEEEYVKTEGKEGSKIVTNRIVELNGVQTKKEEIASEEVVKPVTQVVVRGSLEREVEEEEIEEAEDTTAEEAVEETTYTEEATTTYEEPAETYEEPAAAPVVEASTPAYSASEGQAIVDYALQFVGNPYVWGGTSLTNGCDCSGFVYRVFNDMGYSISRWPDNDYPHVSASELQPGDITRYGGHYCIYIGDGREISAVDEARGIMTHPMYFSNSSFMYGIRVVG